MSVNLKSLIGRLDSTCRTALESAAGLCHSRQNYSVEIEHYLLKLAEPADTDFARILRHYEVDASRLTRDLAAAVSKLKTGNTGAITMSDRIPQWVERAWLIGSVDYDAASVRSGHLLLALITHAELQQIARGFRRRLTTSRSKRSRRNSRRSPPAPRRTAKRAASPRRRRRALSKAPPAV